VRFYNDPLEISVDAWAELLVDRTVTEERDLIVLRLVYESENHEMHASDIAPYLNYRGHGPVNSQIARFRALLKPSSLKAILPTIFGIRAAAGGYPGHFNRARFSKRVVEKTGVQPPKRKNGSSRWWHVPFLGYDKKDGTCAWIMRPELVGACEQVFGQRDSKLVYPGEMAIKDSTLLSEGAVSQIFVNRYERNQQARTACIEHYGCRCAICGFDFEEVYGPIGHNKIHVHHLVPLSGIRQEYKIDPVRDLRPVCPNCHLIIHSKKEPFTIDEVRELIRSSNRQ
jgi:5-methylcytosine-specific restriction protein A